MNCLPRPLGWGSLGEGPGGMRKGRTEEKGSTAERGRGVWRDRSKQEVEYTEKLGERAGETEGGRATGWGEGSRRRQGGREKEKGCLFTGRTGRVTWELKAQRLGLNWGPKVSVQKP